MVNDRLHAVDQTYVYGLDSKVVTGLILGSPGSERDVTLWIQEVAPRTVVPASLPVLAAEDSVQEEQQIAQALAVSVQQIAQALAVSVLGGVSGAGLGQDTDTGENTASSQEGDGGGGGVAGAGNFSLMPDMSCEFGETEGRDGSEGGEDASSAAKEVPNVPKVVSECKPLNFCSWLSSLMFLLWILIPLVVPCQVPDSVCGCAKEGLEFCLEFPCSNTYQCVNIWLYAWLYALFYTIYLGECWNCRTRQYLEGAWGNTDDIASYIIEMRHSDPEVAIELECWHGDRDYEVTFKHREVISFESVVDSSDFGDMGLPEIKAQIRGWGQQSQEMSYSLLAVDSIYKVVYSDRTTEGKIQAIKTSLDNQYSKRDKKYRSEIVINKLGLQKYLLLNFGNTSLLTWGGFWLCSYFGLTIPFRLYFERQTAAVKVHITKVVGSMKPTPSQGRLLATHQVIGAS
jgi:hypothetical protein